LKDRWNHSAPNNYSLVIKALSPWAERATLGYRPAAALFILKGWKSLSPDI